MIDTAFNTYKSMGFLSRVSAAARAFSAHSANMPVRVSESRQSVESPAFEVSPAQLDMLWGLGPTRSGVQINPHTALTIVAVLVAHKILGETLGMLPWMVYEGDEDSKERRRAMDHPAYRLLRRAPNPEMTAFTLKETMMHHVAGWGNAYCRIVKNNADEPIELWPLLPDRTHPERIAGRLAYRVEHAGGGSDMLDSTEVFHVPGLGFDGLKGYSPIALCREGLGAAKAAELYAATFYGNGAKTSGFLKFPGKLKPEALNNLRESFSAMHAGTGNAHKVGVLEGGMDWISNSVPPNEAQFIETRNFGVTDIARLYRIPPHMLGMPSHNSRATIEQASLEFLVYTMTPWMVRFEAEADKKLCGDGAYSKFDERALLRADLTARQNYYAAARQWGWYSANDVLRDEGEQPIGAQGDVYLSPANEQNAKVVIQQIEPVEPTQAGPPGAHAGPFGGANPDAGHPSRRSAIVNAGVRVVVEDAIWRMLRKEANRVGLGNADDTFYAAHTGQVREALIPAIHALRSMMADSGLSPPDMSDCDAAINELSNERHADLGADLPLVASDRAARLIQKITETRCK